MSCSAVLPRICTSREVKNSCLPLQGAVLAPKILFLATQQVRSLAGQRRASPPQLASPVAPRRATPRAAQPQPVTALSAPRVMTVLRDPTALIVLRVMTVLRDRTVLSVPLAMTVRLAKTAHRSATGPVPRGTRVPRDSTVPLAMTAHRGPTDLSVLRVMMADRVSSTTGPVPRGAHAPRDRTATTVPRVPRVQPTARRTDSAQRSRTATRTTTTHRVRTGSIA